MPLPSLGIVERQPIELVLRQCQAMQSEMKYTEALDSGTQLSLVKKHNREGLEEVLILLITKLVNSQHTSQKMSSEAIVDCAVDLVADFWYIKFEEMVLVLNNLRKAKNFNRLDQSVIYEGFANYIEKERNTALESAKIKAMAVSEDAKIKEINIIREKYKEVIEGRGNFTINKINELANIEKEKERMTINNFYIEKSKWIKSKLQNKMIEDKV